MQHSLVKVRSRLRIVSGFLGTNRRRIFRAARQQLRPLATAIVATVLVLARIPAAAADPPCGPRVSCKPEPTHKIATMYLSDGMGATYQVFDVDSAGLAEAAKRACTYYAAAHSNFSDYLTFDGTCRPDLPIAQAGIGGSWGVIEVAGTARQIRRYDGAVLSTSTSTWGMLRAFCADDRADGRALGTDGQCHTILRAKKRSH
jgi:hypothetical protein